MPVLSTFFGIIVRMYKEAGGKHNMPHIHAEYSGDEVVVALDLWKFGNPSVAERDKAISIWKGKGDIARVGGSKIDDHIFDYAEPNGNYIVAFLFEHDLKLPQTAETNG